MNLQDSAGEEMVLVRSFQDILDKVPEEAQSFKLSLVLPPLFVTGTELNDKRIIRSVAKTRQGVGSIFVAAKGEEAEIINFKIVKKDWRGGVAQVLEMDVSLSESEFNLAA